MATEIERKFLVVSDVWRGATAHSTTIRQAYLARSDATTVRVRIVDEREAFITVKGPPTGPIRAEYEYAIPVEDARELMNLRTGSIIEKRRHLIRHHDADWEVDVFEGAHKGLVVAEVELPGADARFERPAWLGTEVTDNPHYSNVHLARAG